MSVSEHQNSEVINTVSRPHKPLARRILRWIGRGTLGLIVLVAGLILVGITYESIMVGGDAERFPAPGQFVTVNGRTMHINCIGEGSPTVIFEAGFGAWSTTWSMVQPDVGAFTRACSYDRAGLGWSEASDEPRTQEQIAIELHELLAAADIKPPYILVGHSMAGKSSRLFASLYPEDTAGLIFVDARHESQEAVNRTSEQNEADSAAYDAYLNTYRILRQIGVARVFAVPLAHLLDPSTSAKPDDELYRDVMFSVRETTLQTMRRESADSLQNDADLRDSQLPDTLPVFVLTAESSLASLSTWELGQQSLATLTSNSIRLNVSETGHNIQIGQHQAVSDAIRAVFDSANTGEALR